MLLFISFYFGIGVKAQIQIITICSEKNGCEMAKVNLTKSQIDYILEKPNFLARESGTRAKRTGEANSSLKKIFYKLPEILFQIGSEGGDATISKDSLVTG